MRINVHHYFADDVQAQILRGIGSLLNQGAMTMTKLDDLIAAQAETATKLDTLATDVAEVGTDLDALIAALGSAAEDPAKMDAALANAQAIRDRVGSIADATRSAADKYTPPAEPSAE